MKLDEYEINKNGNYYEPVYDEEIKGHLFMPIHSYNNQSDEIVVMNCCVNGEKGKYPKSNRKWRKSKKKCIIM